MSPLRIEDNGGLFPEPVCRCGHPYVVHHLTGRGNPTYCTCWSGVTSCPCTKFTQQEEEDPQWLMRRSPAP